MPRTEPLRDLIDLSAYPAATITERGRQHVIVSSRDLDVEVRCKPLSGPGGRVVVRSWLTEPHVHRCPASPPSFWESEPAPMSAIQRLLEAHLAKISPLEMLADTLPAHERCVDLPVVVRLTASTQARLEREAVLSGMEIGRLIGRVLDRVIPGEIPADGDAA
jgi:DNA-binding transcriptional LysR family regulator